MLNGVEMGGGSIRINRPEVQYAVLEVLGIGREEADEKFGFLIEALKHGAPPHGGIAFGIDRLAALLAGRESIRDVIAFPKTASGSDPMTGRRPRSTRASCASWGSGWTRRPPEPAARAESQFRFLRFRGSVPMHEPRLITWRRPELVRQSLSV